MSDLTMGGATFKNRTRIILAVNAGIAVFLFVSYSFDRVYEPLKKGGWADAISLSVFALMFLLTILAAVSWATDIRSKGSNGHRVPASIAIDGVLLLLWSAALVTTCLYGFFIGMAW